MKKITARISLFYFILLTILPVNAAAPGASYRIEALIFEQRMPHFEGGEIWTMEANPRQLDTQQTITVGNASSSSHLTELKEQLTANEAYRVLVHKRWVQNAEAKSTSPRIRLSSPEGDFDGVLNFYLSRYLHLDVNFKLTGLPEESPPEGAVINPLNYWIRENRRVRAKQVVYFDHPKFGALIFVEPLQR